VTIRILAPEVASRIAAGEVIERPVSIVRELLDNALDAGSTRVSVEIEDGGLTLIRVADNGSGIAPPDLELAFERHATSKLASFDDLGRIATLGFRGEALPSIAAASDVEVVSRSGHEPVGVHLALVDGRVVKRQARAAPPGTVITARELFRRVPARRKFLGAPPQEARHVAVLVSHYALAYPGVAFELHSGGRTSLSTPGDGVLRHAFAAIYGADQAALMLDIHHSEAGIRVEGLAGPPSLTRGNRTGVSTFVNGRWVQSRQLAFAVVDAYQSQLPSGRYPVAAVSLHVPPDEVDVNVHPAKAEVRFRDERGVARAVRHAVRDALEAAPVVGWNARPLPPAEDSASIGTGSPAPTGVLPRELLAPPALRSPQPAQPGLPLGRSPGHPDRSGLATGSHRDVLPLLRVVGQMGATYVIAEGPDGMYLIDQHAAHERIRYDAIVAARGRGLIASQPLLDPVLLELDPMLAATLAESREQLVALGLEVEPFGERNYLVRAVPANFAAGDLATALQSLLEKLAGERRVDDPFERAAATVACHTSIRAGQVLAIDEMRRMVEDLELCPTPRTCPHGRPTLIHVSSDIIERQFGRR